MKDDGRKIIATLRKYKNVEIIAGVVGKGHIHLSEITLSKISIFNFMGYLKGKSTLMIYDGHPSYIVSGIRHSGQDDKTDAKRDTS